MRYAFATSVALVVFANLAACSSEPDPEATSVTKSCMKTACDERKESDSSACSDCLDACMGASFDCDPSRSCKVSCGTSRECSDSERERCVQQGFKVELPTASSAPLADACKRVFARHAECGVEVVSGPWDCDVWARTERPERVKEYDCTANAACDADLAACDLPPTDFGDRLCAKIDATCGGFCTDKSRTALNLQGAWLKDRVMAAGMTCAEQATCDDAKTCFGAWVSAAKL